MIKYVAINRIEKFMEFMRDFHEFQKSHPYVVLVGGRTGYQKKNAKGQNNPRLFHDEPTDRAHFVQADIIDKRNDTQFPHDKLPKSILNLIADTAFVPRTLNRGVHKSIDKVQKIMIQIYQGADGNIDLSNKGWFTSFKNTYAGLVLHFILNDATDFSESRG